MKLKKLLTVTAALCMAFTMFNGIAEAGSVYTGNTMGVPRANAAAVTLDNGKILIVGGQSGNSPVDKAFVLDPSTNQWSPTGPNSLYSTTQAVKLPDGRVFATDFTQSAIYDPNTNSWTPASMMSVSRPGAALTLLKDGKVLVSFGGASSVTSLEVYDPVTNAWTVIPTPKLARKDHVAVYDETTNKVYFFGGTATGYSNAYIAGDSYVSNPTTSSVATQVQVWDVATNSWSLLTLNAGIPIATGQKWIRLQDGRILVVGGAGPYHSGNVANKSAYTINLSTGQVTFINGTFHRINHTLSMLPDGRVLVIGGYHSSSSPSGDKIEVIDPTNNTATTFGTLNIGRHFAASVTVGNEIYVLGGSSAYNISDVAAFISSVEIIDGATANVSVLDGTSSFVRMNPAITALKDGRVVILGGHNTSTAAEIFDPSTGIWTVQPNVIPSPRPNKPKAVTLKNGKALFLGGGSTGNEATMYDPSTNTWSTVANLPFTIVTAALALPDGKAMAVDTSARKAAMYDPNTNIWTSTSNMPNMGSPTYLHAVLTTNNKMVFVGAGTQYMAIYNINTDAWSTFNMGTTYNKIAAVPSDDGKVYIFLADQNKYLVFNPENPGTTPYNLTYASGVSPISGGGDSRTVAFWSPDKKNVYLASTGVYYTIDLSNNQIVDVASFAHIRGSGIGYTQLPDGRIFVSHGASTDFYEIFNTTDSNAAFSISATEIHEAPINDGSINMNQIVTLNSGTFDSSISKSDVIITGLPSGLDYTVTRVSPTQLTITFIGKATAHAAANSVNDVSIAINDAKIIGSELINSPQLFNIVFRDPYVMTITPGTITPNSIELNWTPIPDAEGYIIERKKLN